MFRSAQKCIAILLILWLPLVSGNAFARAMVMSVNDIQAQSMAEQGCPEHTGLNQAPDSNCTQCEFCQIACAAYLPPTVLKLALQFIPRPSFPPFLGELHSLTLPLFDPPPITA